MIITSCFCNFIGILQTFGTLTNVPTTRDEWFTYLWHLSHALSYCDWCRRRIVRLSSLPGRNFCTCAKVLTLQIQKRPKAKTYLVKPFFVVYTPQILIWRFRLNLPTSFGPWCRNRGCATIRIGTEDGRIHLILKRNGSAALSLQ